MLFASSLENWKDWGRVYGSKEAFAPLAAAILEKEGLPREPLCLCTPGTNANFRTGRYLMKIYAPEETGAHPRADCEAERFGLDRAQRLGIPAPRLTAYGKIEDRYTFWYLIMEYLALPSFRRCRETMSDKEKRRFGRRLRRITDRLNTPCSDLPVLDPLSPGFRRKGWERFPAGFQRERRAFIEQHPIQNPVYVHGDLCADNLLMDENGGPVLLDFADGIRAPVAYEQALVAVELFRLEAPFLLGYFGEYKADELAQLCVEGLLVHTFGGEILLDYFRSAAELDSLSALERKLLDALNAE